MNLYEIILQKQKELGLTNTAFSEYLGLTRQWLCTVQYGQKRMLNNSTMYVLNTKLGIPMETLIDYNESIRQARLEARLNKEGE